MDNQILIRLYPKDNYNKYKMDISHINTKIDNLQNMKTIITERLYESRYVNALI